METSKPLRKRLSRTERERLILEEAIRFFAEVGLGGQTRALADRLGITQPLLYRYFPDKESLIERVFEEVYLKRWHPEWEALLRDRSRTLTERLTTFYQEYCDVIFKPQWVRIFMFAGLKGSAIHRRYMDLVRDNIVTPCAIEWRHELGLPTIDEVPLNEMETNLIHGLHGGIFHIGIRRWIYEVPVPDDDNALIEAMVQAFCKGCETPLRHLVAPTIRREFQAPRVAVA